MSPDTALRLRDHVARLADEHPPLDPDAVDYTVHDPHTLRERYGHVLDYMARVELEVDRNVLELMTMLPDPPEIDRHFYADVWQPQEIQHGLILDRLQVELGRDPSVTDTTTISAKLRILGTLSHVDGFQDVCRMIYYLTGMSTERSAVLAYNLLHDGVRDLGEIAIAESVVAPIRRQEPGHYAFYRMSATAHWARLSGWQRWLVRRMRAVSFGPVGVNNREQHADFGEVMNALGITDQIESFAEQGVRIERDLLWAHHQGLKVPEYVLRAFREAVALAAERHAAT